MTPVVAALLGLAAGGLIGVLATWLVTRGREADDGAAALATSQLLAVVESLKAMVVVIGAHGSVTASSPSARGTGLVRGTKVWATKVADAVAEVQVEGHDRCFTAEISRGPELPAALLELQVSRLVDGTVLITGEDATADQRFSDTRRDFVTNITHELKTPIGAIILLTEALDAAIDDPDAIKTFVARLGAESQRLNDLVSQIIALSRLQAEDPMLAAEPVEFDAVVESTVQRCRALAESAEVSISVGGVRGLRVLGDANQLDAAVTNLVQNAIAYSEPGARVAILTRRAEDGWLELRVSDNGIGISEADLERVFERFYRVDYSRSRANGGTGLGLSIVKHVAAAHGGEVVAWSRLGSGSTFTLRLPEYLPEGAHL